MANEELQRQYLEKLLKRKPKDDWIEIRYYARNDPNCQTINTLLVRKEEVMLMDNVDTGQCIMHFIHYPEGACYPVEDYETLKKRLIR